MKAKPKAKKSKTTKTIKKPKQTGKNLPKGKRTGETGYSSSSTGL